MARIRSVATALPPHRVDQATAREACRRLWGDHRLLAIFNHAGVETRYFAHTPEYYLDGLTFERRNRDWIAQAVVLGERAARAALEMAGLRPVDVDRFWFSTTTGLATPSLDALLCHRMGFRPDVVRQPLFGIGCAGGAAALARASMALLAAPSRRALVLSVELCSQTFRSRDDSVVNLVGSALFGDGAAAAVVEGDGVATGGAEIVDSAVELLSASSGVMEWTFENGGMKLVLSAEIPTVVRDRVVPSLDRFLAKRFDEKA
jgi:alkylresorcinol/alkylpyrone synthase